MLVDLNQPAGNLLYLGCRAPLYGEENIDLHRLVFVHTLS